MPSRRKPFPDVPTSIDTIQLSHLDFYNRRKRDAKASLVTSISVNHEEVVAHARKLITSIASLNSEPTNKLLSPSTTRAVIHTEPATDEDSHVSSPTVSCGTFSDDDFSMCSTVDLLNQAKNRIHQPNPTNFEADDLLSTSSSLNTRRQRQISGLRKKLHTSETTKLELLNQCADLWTRVENVECNNARVTEFRQQNVRLREDSATMERDFMNEVSKLVHQMKEMDKKYTDTIVERDNRIAEMEMELRELNKSSGVEYEPNSED